MKKILIHFDSDSLPSTFDAVVACDANIDHLIQLAGITSENCKPQVEGAIFTRAPKNKKSTAILIGGSDLSVGQDLLDTITSVFFQNFRVSVMLDSNGCNTTAAACVALLAAHYDVADKPATVLAGTGPVGQRIATMLALSGARVKLSSRTLARATQACEAIAKQFKVAITPVEMSTNDHTDALLDKTELLVCAGKGGIQLLSAEQWETRPNLKVLADVNTQLPLGLEGIDMMDKSTERHGKLVFGGIGIGALKLQLQRECINQLFNSNDQVFDAVQILALAHKLAS